MQEFDMSKEEPQSLLASPIPEDFDGYK